jgi:hypothetical protein
MVADHSTDKWFGSGTKTFESPGHAYVIRLKDIVESGRPRQGDDSHTITVGGTSAIAARAALSDGDAVFVGIARERDVAGYLRDVNVAEVTDVVFPPLGVESHERGGARAPTRPDQQPFWLASAAGSGNRQVEWPAPFDDYQLVVMRADGSPRVQVNLAFGVGLQYDDWVGMGLLGMGLAFVGLGIWMGFLGVRWKRRGIIP